MFSSHFNERENVSWPTWSLFSPRVSHNWLVHWFIVTRKMGLRCCTANAWKIWITQIERICCNHIEVVAEQKHHKNTCSEVKCIFWICCLCSSHPFCEKWSSNTLGTSSLKRNTKPVGQTFWLPMSRCDELLQEVSKWLISQERCLRDVAFAEVQVRQLRWSSMGWRSNAKKGMGR